MGRYHTGNRKSVHEVSWFGICARTETSRAAAYMMTIKFKG